MVPLKTVEQKGSKQVKVKTAGQDKSRITAIITITADGNILAPYLIFKAAPKKKVYYQFYIFIFFKIFTVYFN